MKWIGQHIWDNISRFRNDVYLENVSLATPGNVIGMDANKKLTYFEVGSIDHDSLTNFEPREHYRWDNDISSTATIHTNNITDLHGAGVDGTASRILTDNGSGGITSNGYLTFRNSGNVSLLTLISNEDTGDFCSIATTTHGATTITTVDDDATAAHFEIEADGNIVLDSAATIKAESDQFNFESPNANDPLVIIKNTANDATSGRLRFLNQRGADGQDDDETGIIEFYSYDDGTPTGTLYAEIKGIIHDATNGEESGQLKLQVASHDGGIEDGIVLTGGSVDTEVDVAIGKGSASVTTVAGSLQVGGSTNALTNAGLVVVANQSNITGVGTLTSGDATGVVSAASTSAAGKVELATTAEATTGTDTARAVTPEGVAAVHATAQSGKNYRIVNCNFRADIGTTKYYLPLKSQDEQTVLTREENQEVAVCDGRLVSLTWRAEAFHSFGSDATVTFGVETNTVGSSYSGGYSEVETQTVTVEHTDDQHLWHVVFSEAKHWDSTDMFTISMQSDTDITGSNERIFITLVIEDDWSTYLA